MRKSKKVKKPISSSPNRISLKEKKNSSNNAKTPNTTSRKKLNNSLYSNRNQNQNYNFHEMANKFCLINFSSMPSTPTGNSFIKKFGEKMNIEKANKEKMLYNFCKEKQLSLTNPNMVALLNQVKTKKKNMKLKNSENYLNSSGVLSSRNDESDGKLSDFLFANYNGSLNVGGGASKNKKHRKPMTERIR